MTSYEKQATDFLEKTGATIEINFSHKGKHFEDDKEERNIYDVTIKRNGNEYSFKFGDSIANTREVDKLKQRAGYEGRYATGGERRAMQKYRPSAYDVLACIEKYEPEHDIFEFAKEFGYTIDSRADYRKVDRILEAVEDEYKNVVRLFGDVMEELEEIQ